MLEGLVAWVLNNYLGKYVENLNTDQLSIALLSGEVELENLPLKKDALRQFGVPIQIQAGFIGKIKLQIPVRQIRSAPWVIVIEQLYVVATPVNLSEWDTEAEEFMAQEYKLSLLDALEAQWRAENEAQPDTGYYASSFSSWMNYGTSLVTNIIENLQLKIKDVHLRYEDSITCGESNAFSCGLIMESFSAESCDSNWHRTFTTFPSSQSGGCSFKLLELQRMAFYWDRMTLQNDMLANLTLGELALRMCSMQKSQHQFVLSPVSAVAQLRRERCENPLRSRTRPRLTCQLTLDEVPLVLTDCQYNQMVGCVRGLSLIGRLRIFRQWRPNVPVVKNPRAWWIYAVKCHLPDSNFMLPKPTWDTCLSSAKLCLRYVDIYSALLITPTITLPSDSKDLKDQVEWSTPFQELKPLREAAMRRAPISTTNNDKNGLAVDHQGAQDRSILMRWFPQWWYSSGPPQNSVPLPSLSPSNTTPSLEGEILDALADSVENNTLLKRDTVFGQFKFTLSKGSLKLCTIHKGTDPEETEKADLTKLELQFENVGFSIESRPRTSSHNISIDLGAVYLKDYITENTLFPILIAPQGTIREGLGCAKFTSMNYTWIKSFSSGNTNTPGNTNDCLFHLEYERKPIGSKADYRLFVKSQSLEVVYNAGAVRWLIDFLSHPLSLSNQSKIGAAENVLMLNGAYAHVKNTTKMHLINQWEHILQGDLSERSLWQLELDISAPQILLVEKFIDKNGVVAVLDFGKMHLSNGCVEEEQVNETLTEEDDNEMYMTPCSTPPGSEASDINLTDCGTSPLPSDTPQKTTNFTLTDALHQRLYDRYTIEFSDLQVLVGRIKDNWKYANTKGTSSLHILDRFNIFIQVERRVIYTSDPQYPSVTLCGTLPHLVVHLNEQKLLSIQSLVAELNTPQAFTTESLNTTYLSEEWKISPPVEEPSNEHSETEQTERSSNQMSRLLMLQFAIDQMALEVQSRGRSIAEVQVCGVRAAFTKRLFDFNLSLSVHSLLLVDALQTYGPDFELLVASHKHVGMDSVSGSIRDSEPTSPISPSSPPEGTSLRPLHPPPAAALSQALHYLNTQPKSNAHLCASPTVDFTGGAVATGIVDSEALIVIEVMVVSSECPSSQGEELRIANILFNNLDIIANQETIVELIGFAKRVSSVTQPVARRVLSEHNMKSRTLGNFSSGNSEDDSIIARTEITFDFHRLSVLLLRASMQDGNVIGKKIATATMSDAKIQATVANTAVEMNGSLGGLQIVSLCPGTTVHQRIVSVGHDPLTHHNIMMSTELDLAQTLAQELYRGLNMSMSKTEDEGKALTFNIKKALNNVIDDDVTQSDKSDDVSVSICVHMASVWYTHSGIFIGEIQSCATEFKQYLSNLARSIKAAATDMAIGLVQTRSESIYSNPRVSGSMEWVSPRRPRSISIGPPQDSDAGLDFSSRINLQVDVMLETPVVVLPRSPASTEVFVARLGNISIGNKPELSHHYTIQFRDINVYSLDIANHLNIDGEVNSVESLYCCGSQGKPILHDTTLQLIVEKTSATHDTVTPCENFIQVTGKVITPLKVSLTRHQYEQLLDTVSTLAVTSPGPTAEPHPSFVSTADSTGVTTLSMDPHLRAQIFSPHPLKSPSVESIEHIKVDFQLPIFTVELRGDFGKGEQSLVDLSFRDFFVDYDKCQSHETNIQMSLRSITMEDLLRDVDSRHRFMMVSHKPLIPKSDFVSRSSPDLRVVGYEASNILPTNTNLSNARFCSSLPDKLNSKHNMENIPATNSTNRRSAREISLTSKEISFPQDNLVLISMKLRDPQHPSFREKYKNVRKVTKIDFNCLDLVVSVDSWVVVLDFFGMGSEADSNNDKKLHSTKKDNKSQPVEIGETETEMSVRSLNVVLLRPQREVCRANISGLEVLVIGGSVSEPGGDGGRRISGTLGSMSLTDLSPHGRIWRERFISSGKEALNFQYERFRPADALIADCDTRLLIEMSSIVYVHTKRFVGEIQAFFREFSQLQSVISQARQKVSVTANSRSTRMQMSIECFSSAILVPVSSGSTSAVVADLDKLSVHNTFKKAGSDGTISSIRDPEDPVRELLDVMTIHLNNMDVYCGQRFGTGMESETRNMTNNVNTLGGGVDRNCLLIGPAGVVIRQGPSLLADKCKLVLQVEKNLEDYHNVADMSIQGTLNTLDGAIDLIQYKVIKGLLANNLGENTDDLYVSEHSYIPLSSTHSDDKVWILTSIRLDLLNVTLRLETEHGESSLACINFIKSRLVVETFSDMTQVIDLLSQEISLSDTRYKTDPVNKRSNVFTNIVKPMGLEEDNNGQHSVQAEVHARKRKEHSAYTILVNNMRLMAILDWWQAVNEFIMSPPTEDIIDLKIGKNPTYMENVGGFSPNHRMSPVTEPQFELKLNITESQVVFVEDTSQWDTNAVILKSTTVITYKPGSEPKPLSCVLNHCEVFSCVLGMEEETALSIIDPVTVQIDLSALKVLKIQTPQLSVRLSYHDVRMLMKMFESLPQQTRGARAATESNTLPVNQNRESVQKLCGLGFSARDCANALSICDGRLEQAALWLTEHSMAVASLPAHHFQHNAATKEMQNNSSTLSFECLQIKADCISICVIDDCRDSDVPLLELSLSDMSLSQDIRQNDSLGKSTLTSPRSPSLCNSLDTPELKDIDRETGPGGGRLQCKLTSDYYNRALSGWEPFIEPWRCDASWEYGLTSNLKRNRLQMEINSTEVLNLNITSTLMDLYSLVKTNWTQDYYSLSNRGEMSPKSSPPGYRRRSPFVPFALHNQTGCKLWFTTIVTTADIVSDVQLSDPDDSWTEVLPGQTAPFKFGNRGKQRHIDSHKLRLHQLGVRIDGWNSITPVCVDKVGVFFRHATHTKSDIEARAVFAVTLEGSARKLVTVRSALQLVNQLPEAIEVRADNIGMKTTAAVWSGASVARSVSIASGETWCIPLSHNPTPMWVRPLVNQRLATSPPGNAPAYLYCAQPIDWRLAARQTPQDCLQLPHVCHSNTQSSYRFCCILRREKYPLERGLPQPGHIMILKPPVRLVNLLPVELNYRLGLSEQGVGRVAAGQTAPLSQIDVQKSIEISIYMEGFPGAASVVIQPTATTSFSMRLKLSDMSGRKLTLNAHVSIKRSDTIKVSISAAYWIVNRTGVPIVFRQEGVPTETAGQFEEHEIARMVAPLLFSFADSDGSPTVVARVGAGVIPNGQPQWCSSFGLGAGIMVRRLVVGNIGGVGGSERVLLVGIAVRPGRGHYRHTNICTISPRFQIHNNTSFHLQFSQKCYATTMADPGASASHASAVPGCAMPFHWPRQDRDQLLCVRLLDLPHSHWSGGFRIDTNHSLHINIRDNNAACFFLRLEVVLQGATYFIVFTDAETMPPPIRLDNYSLVPLTFHQGGCKDESLLKAHSSKPWALVEPCGFATLAVRAPGGTGTTIDLNKIDETKSLTYQNFIYIVFTGTHQYKTVSSIGGGVESSQLVLEVTSGSTGAGRVVLARKRCGERAQLWRLNKRGHLMHEGSSPPQPSNAPPDVSAPHTLVLDIEGPAPQPSTMVGLCVRRVNPRRASTQTWHFTHDGYLRCAHSNMNVQPLDGFFGLRQGNRAVLGLPGPSGPHVLPNGVPIEHAVSSQTLRPGSGFLNVTVTTDGPTRVVKITDVKQQEGNWCEGRSNGVNSIEELELGGREVQVRVAVGGVGLSFVSRAPPLELLFGIFSGVLLEAVWSPRGQALNLSVQDVQFDNQLLGTSCPVLLHSTRSRAGNSSGSNSIALLPTIQMSMERSAAPPDTRYNAHIFKHFIISLRPISVHLEERLLLKLCLWAGIGGSEEDAIDKEEPDETDFETQKILSEVTAAHAKRYYFGVLKLVPSQIRLSMQTAGKLPLSLAALKKRLGLTLIKFEDAGVELEPFIRWHPFETSQFLWHSILKHYKDELKWQAAIILGSVDFLGNPLGFVQDVSDGVSGLIYEGSVGALVKNVTHGLSNSAAKVSESLGDGLGRVILDEAHEETRAKIRGVGETGGGVSHLAAGFRGLGLGLLGGITSLVKHSYEGAAHQGLPGFLTGVGKGLIGTVTKPVVGVLDLAAETAAALRETSRRSDRWLPERYRPPRCPMGPGGLLPRYSRTQSTGHLHLYAINGRDYEEGFLAYDCIRGNPYDIRALVSTRNLRIFTCTTGDPHIVIETHLSNLICCQAVTNSQAEHYIELTVRVDGTSGVGVRRPQIQCDTAELARWVSHQVNYAKCMFHEKLYTLQEADYDFG